MPFNEEKIRTRVAERKVDFIIKIILFSILMITSLVVILFLSYNTTIIVIGVVCFLWLGYSLGKTWKSSDPKSLFSKEFRGTVTKISYSGARSSSVIGKTRISNKTLCGELYIKSDSGETVILTSLERESTEAYKIGDSIHRIKGAKYPIVTSRNPTYFPCPICGSLRNRRENKCRRCGIES